MSVLILLGSVLAVPSSTASAGSTVVDSGLDNPEASDAKNLWTESSRTWALDDDTFLTHLFSSPVNFQDHKGRWQEIDTAVVPSKEPGFAWQNAAGPVRVLFPADIGDGPVRIEEDGSWLTFALHDAKGAAVIQGSTVTYQDALPGVSVVYEVIGTGIKESLVLSEGATASFSFDVRKSADLRIDETDDDGFDVKDGSGESLFEVAPPNMVDATDEPAEPEAISSTLSRDAGADQLDLSADRAWLDDPARLYPVVIDPTVVLTTAGGRDCYLNEASPNATTCTETRVKVGQAGNQLDRRRGLLYFDPSGIPGSVIEGATLQLYCGGGAPPAIDIQVRRATAPTGSSWTPWGTSSTWNKRNKSSGLNWTAGPGGDFDGAVFGTKALNCSASSYRTWDDGPTFSMRDLVAGWADGTWKNEGIALKVPNADEGVNQLFNFYSAETTNPPLLTVVSSRPNGLEGGGFQNVVAVNPTDANIVVSGGDVAGIHLSRDGGVTWTSQNTCIPDQQHLKVAALTWADATTLYALVGNGTNGAVMRGIVESDPNAVQLGVWIHWEKVASSPVGNGGSPANGTGLPGDANLPKVKVPTNPANTATDNVKADENPRSVGRLLVVDGPNNRIYAGSYDDGVFRAALSGITSDEDCSTTTTPAVTWTRLGLAGEFVRSIDVASNTLFATTYRGPTGTSASSQGQVWRVTGASTAAADTAIRLTGSPSNVEEVRSIAGTLYGVVDERDAPGAVYTEDLPPGGVVESWIDPAAAITYKRGLYRLENAATAAVSTAWAATSHTVGGVTRPDVSTGIMPGTIDTPKNQVWYSLDGYGSGSAATLWMGARNPAPEEWPGQLRAITSLSTTGAWGGGSVSSNAQPTAAPNTDVLVAAGQPARPWWVAAARPSFMLGKGTYTASDIAIAPTDTNTIYAAGRSGVWRSIDGGSSWRPAVRSMAVTINRQVLLDSTDADNVDIGNVDYRYIGSADRMLTVGVPAPEPDYAVSGVSVAYALGRDAQNWLAIAFGHRDTNTLGNVWVRTAAGAWSDVDLDDGLLLDDTPRPIGVLAVTNTNCGRSILAAVAGQGVYASVFSGGAYQEFDPVSPGMLGDTSLKRASFVVAPGTNPNHVFLYDKTSGVWRGTCSSGTWSSWTRILDYPSTFGAGGSPAAGDGSGYLAPDTTSPDVLYVTTAGNGTGTYPPAVFKITNATTAGPNGAAKTTLTTGGGGCPSTPSITDPGPIDIDKDGGVDSDSFASIVLTEPATASHPVRMWSVNPGSATDPCKWNLRELDGLTAQPLIPLDLDYDARNGNLYIATFGIGVYTAYLPSPGPV